MNEQSGTEAPQAASQAMVMLGPFLGYVTSTTIKIWLQIENGPSELWVTAHPNDLNAEPDGNSAKLLFEAARLP